MPDDELLSLYKEIKGEIDRVTSGLDLAASAQVSRVLRSD